MAGTEETANNFLDALLLALDLITGLNAGLIEIVGLSLSVSLSAVLIAGSIGLPLGAALAVYNFRGRQISIVLLNALMGLPPVFIGLTVYLLLSRSGPLGALDLLFTPTAMVIAQAILITPIVAALSRQTCQGLYEIYQEQLRSLGATPLNIVLTILWDARISLLTAIMAGFGRAIAEVGAVFIVGGNIENFTRVMTTTIALETSKGNLALAMALGIILVLLSIVVNGVASITADSVSRSKANR